MRQPHDDRRAGGHPGHAGSCEHTVAELMQSGIVSHQHDMIAVLGQISDHVQHSIGGRQVEPGVEDKVNRGETKRFPSKLRGADGADGRTGHNARWTGQQRFLAIAAKVSFLQEGADGGCGELASFIEWAVMVTQPRMIPTGLRVTQDGQILHGS